MKPILIVLSLVLLSSCKMMTFDKVPGMIIKDYPEELYAQYLIINKNKGVKDTQIISISKDGIQSDWTKNNSFFSFKDSSLVLSHFGNFYFMSLSGSSKDSLPHYIVFPFQFDSEYLYLHQLGTDKKSLKRMKKMGLVAINDPTYIKMNEEQFKKYCHKYLKKRKAQKYKRIIIK